MTPPAAFALALRKGMWVGRSASATLGDGGPEITLKTIDGDIRLRRGRGGALCPAASTADRTPAPPPLVVVSPRPAATPQPPLSAPVPPARDSDWETRFEHSVASLVEASVETALQATGAALAEVDEEVRREVQRELRQEMRREFGARGHEAKRDAVLDVIRSGRDASSSAERTAMLAWAAAQPEIGDPAVRAAWSRATDRLPDAERQRVRATLAEPGR